MKKILFIGNTRLGDAVMSTGLLDSLCNYYKADATVVCGKVAESIFVTCPFVDKIITLKKKIYSLHWLEVWKEVKNKKWDIICDLRGSPIIWLIFAKKRLILSSRDSKFKHRLERLSKLNPDGSIPFPKVWIDENTYNEAKSYLGNKKGPFIVIAPTANWAAKIWNVEKFAKLIRIIINYDSFKNGTVLIVGGPGEESIGIKLIKLIKEIDVINLIGKPIMPTAGVISLSKIFIGNDSGLMHLSAATGIPTLGLFGPTDDKLYAPTGKKCMVVRTTETPSKLMSSPSFNHRTSGSLMDSLSVSMVEKAITQLLKKSH